MKEKKHNTILISKSIFALVSLKSNLNWIEEGEKWGWGMRDKTHLHQSLVSVYIISCLFLFSKSCALLA